MSQNMSADEIRLEMAALRREIDINVEELMENAETLSDWRFYIRRYPWQCMTAAAVAGYLVVPKRLQLITPDADALFELAKQQRVVIKPQPEAQPKGPLGALSTFLVNAGLRAAVAFVGQKAGELLRDGAEKPPHAAARRGPAEDTRSRRGTV